MLANQNKPHGSGSDPIWRSCSKYITWCLCSGISSHQGNANRIKVAEGYANPWYHWPNMNWAASDLSKEWKRLYQHCEFTFGGPLKCSEKKICNLVSFVGDKGREIYLCHLSVGNCANWIRRKQAQCQ